MASAMVRGILCKGFYRPDQIGCTSATGETAAELARQTGIHYTSDPDELLSHATTIILACKPQQLSALDPVIKDYISGRIIISILAGIRMEKLTKSLPGGRNYVRAMPNTPGQIGAGITCFAARHPLSDQENIVVEKILSGLGKMIHLPEEQLDAVTALSGSGPAYVFEFIAALLQGGINAGLSPEVSRLLVLETTLGAAHFLAQSGETPELLRDQVTSPGGTTAAGLKVMESHNFRQILNDTLQAAKNRSIELSQLP